MYKGSRVRGQGGKSLREHEAREVKSFLADLMALWLMPCLKQPSMPAQPGPCGAETCRVFKVESAEMSGRGQELKQREN